MGKLVGLALRLTVVAAIVGRTDLHVCLRKVLGCRETNIRSNVHVVSRKQFCGCCEIKCKGGQQGYAK